MAIDYFKTQYQKVISVISLKPFDESTEAGRAKERYRKVLLSTGSSIIYKVISISTGLISVPLTVNYLGEERFGMWMTITSLLALMTFSDLGLGNGLVNAVAKSKGSSEKNMAEKSTSSVFFMLFLMSIFMGILLLIIYPFIDWGGVFNVTTPLAIKEAGLAFIVLFSGFLLNMPLDVVQKVQLGLQLGYKNNLWLSFGAFLGLLGVLFAIYYQLGLPYLVGLMMGGPILATIMNGFFLFKTNPNLIPKLKYFELSVSKRLLGVGSTFFLLQLATTFGGAVDNILIAHILGASAVASYAITKKLFLAIQVSQFIIVPLWPAFIESIARNDYKWAEYTLKKLIKLSIVIGGLSALPLIFYGQEIITLWVNKEVVPTVSLLIGFFLWTIFQNYGGAMSVFLNNDQLIKRQLSFVILSAIFSVIFQFIFCSLYGLIGIIYGQLLGYLLFYVVPAYKLAFNFLRKNKEVG